MKKKKNLLSIVLSSLCPAIFLSGCSTIVLFDPKGPIGDEVRFVIITAILLMLIVLVPVFIMGFWFPRKYRASNTESTYMPKWSHSTKIEFFMWGFPIAIVTGLAILAWTSTHSLDPYKPIPSAEKPITIEAISLDWKWLFIYPDYNIATVNEITFPVNVPISFKLTSETVMTSFFIPRLGSQIYAMGGMQTRLHLLADEPGTYAGHNQQISGRGYVNMHFKAHAVSREEFQSWVQKIRQSPEKLDPARYETLAKPNDGYFPVTYFSSVKPGLFEDIIRKFDPNWAPMPFPMSGRSVSTHAKPDVAKGN
jgi:cytochrome o ubiquinol oxidase subunit II